MEKTNDPTIKQKVAELAEDIRDEVNKKIGHVAEGARAVKNTASDALKDMAGVVAGAAKDVAGSVTGAAKDVAGSVTGAARDIAGSVTGAARDIADKAGEHTQKLRDTLDGHGTNEA
jgi:uncharacterized protein YjbJ (UPF0337 family)